MYFSDSVCILLTTDGVDTTWSYSDMQAGKNDSITISEFLEYTYPDRLIINEITRVRKIAKSSVEGKVYEAETDWSKDRFGLLSSRLISLLLKNSDSVLVNSLAPRDKASQLYNGIRIFLTKVPNLELKFLSDQLSLVDKKLDLKKLSIDCFESEDYENALIYSKLFLITNFKADETDLRISMIFELSNLAFELQNKYAICNENNNILNSLIFSASDDFPETRTFTKDWKW